MERGGKMKHDVWYEDKEMNEHYDESDMPAWQIEDLEKLREEQSHKRTQIQQEEGDVWIQR